jgi:hypothetical protein
LAVGAWSARGTDLEDTYKKTGPLYLAGLELAATLQLVGPLELALTGRADAPLIRPRFYYKKVDETESTLHQTKFVVGSLFTGLGLRFR